MKLKGIVTAGLIGLSFWGCRKNFPEQTPEQKALQEDTYAASAVLSVEGLLNELEFIVKQAPSYEQSGTFLNCATINRQSTAEGYKIDIQFNSSSICSDNTLRSGKISLSYNENTGSVLVQPLNYTLGQTAVSGNYLFRRLNDNQAERMSLEISDGKFSLYDGSYIKFDVNRTTKVKNAGLTDDVADDEVEVEESHYDMEVYGYSSSVIVAEVKTPCLLKYSCSDKFRPRAGSIEFKRANGSPRKIEFGNGNCADVPKMSEVN